MKWITAITGVAVNVLKMFQQVDRLFQKVNTQLYTAEVTFENQIYTVKVSDKEGNAVDGALVLVYVVEPGQQTYNLATGKLSYLNSPSFNTIDGYTSTWRYAIVRIPKDGFSLSVVGNSRATLKACVLGKEVSV